MSSLRSQVGGDHYKGMRYQPVVFASKMRFNFIQGSILKYISRYPQNNGKEDLEKAMHFCQLGVELRPVNFAESVEEEAKKFVQKNGFDTLVEELINDLASQFWFGVSDKILKISEKIYGTKS